MTVYEGRPLEVGGHRNKAVTVLLINKLSQLFSFGLSSQ